jgi:hypothetical protein
MITKPRPLSGEGWSAENHAVTIVDIPTFPACTKFRDVLDDVLYRSQRVRINRPRASDRLVHNQGFLP